TLTPILDSAGFLQGWSTTITPPVSSTNGSITLSMTVTGTLTYLSGTSFVTNTVTYISGPVATINTLGGFVPPVGVSLSTSPASTTLSSTAATTVIATEYTYDNPSSCTVQFFQVYLDSSTRANIGSPTSAPTSQITTTVGGKTVYQKTYQISYTFPVVTTSSSTSGNINLGFIVTDNTTGLSTTYQSTTTYFEAINLISGGGGGGGGCPAVDMFVDDTHQVCDVIPGFEVDALRGEPS